MEPHLVIAPEDATENKISEVQTVAEHLRSVNLSLPDAFSFCPRCGKRACESGCNPFECDGCHFRFFFGPTVAVAAIVSDDEGRVLFLKRAREPARGKLGIPGGFVDVGEGAEEALKREVFEETRLDVVRSTYLGSFPNSYAYRGLIYSVTDLFFHCQILSLDVLKTDPSEVEDYFFLRPGLRELDQMAFQSNRLAVERWLATRSR